MYPNRNQQLRAFFFGRSSIYAVVAIVFVTLLAVLTDYAWLGVIFMAIFGWAYFAVGDGRIGRKS